MGIVRIKRSSTQGSLPIGLLTGELALNIADRKLYAIDGNNTLQFFNFTSDAEKVVSGPISQALAARLSSGLNLSDLTDKGVARTNLSLDKVTNTSDASKILQGSPIGDAIIASGKTADAISITGVSPSGYNILTGSPSYARGTLGLASSALVEDADRALRGNPVGDAIFASAGLAYVDKPLYKILSTDKMVVNVGSMNDSRTVLLPDAESYPVGQSLYVLDETGSPSDSKPLLIGVANGSNDLLQSTIPVRITHPYGGYGFKRGPTNRWLIDRIFTGSPNNKLRSALMKTGAVGQNLWYNGDGALGPGGPVPVYNDALVAFAQDRWAFQQATLTPHVSVRRVVQSDGDYAVRMLNGFEASATLTVGTGNKAFSVGPGLNFAVGFPVKAVVNTDLSVSMSGKIISYDNNIVVINVTSFTGNGTYNQWVIGAVGTTKSGRYSRVTTQPTPPGSHILYFADTTGILRGSNIEFAFDAAFTSINGIQRGAYVVDVTPTTVTMSLPAIAPTGAPANTAIVANQTIFFYGDNGVFGYQDISTSDAVAIKNGTLNARTTYLSFDVQAFGVAGIASIMYLGYTDISSLGRSLAQCFPVGPEKRRVVIELPGDTVGDPETWHYGYDASTTNFYAALGFAWESQGTPTAQNIPPGRWFSSKNAQSEVFAVGGSDRQTLDLTGTVGAWVDVTNVKFELDAPTDYVAPVMSFDYPTQIKRTRAPTLPTEWLESSRNAVNKKKFRRYLDGNGTYIVAGYSDDELTEYPGFAVDRSGSLYGFAYPQGDLVVGAGGILQSLPTNLLPYTATIAAQSGTSTFAAATTRYLKRRNFAFVHISVPVTSRGTGSGSVVVSLPFAATGSAYMLIGFDSRFSGNPVFGRIFPGESTVQIINVNGSYPGEDNATLNVSGWYEIS